MRFAGALFAAGACLLLSLEPSASASTSTAGTQLWVARYHQPLSIISAATSVAASPDGSRVFVTGFTGGYEYGTVAYDASTGRRLWVSLYQGPGDDSSAFSLAVPPDGSEVFVTGESNVAPDANDTDYATVAYDAFTGTKLWVARYRGPGRGVNSAYNFARSLAVSPDGSQVFVTGGSQGTTRTGGDYATVAYDAFTGTKLWAARYNGPGSSADGAFAVGASPDGSRVFVTGASTGTTTNLDYATVAYDASTGRMLWARRYDGPGSGIDEARSLAVSRDGSMVFVTGQSVDATGLPDYATVAYEAATGARLWVRRYDGPGSGSDVATSLAVSPDGSEVFVTGASQGTGTHHRAYANLDYATVAYDESTAARRWVSRYNGPGDGHDAAYSLTMSADGSRVFVTGGSKGVSTGWSDYATVAYDASTGTQLWVGRYNDPANRGDEGGPIVTSPDSNKVFVTGQSSGTYATVAYAG